MTIKRKVYLNGKYVSEQEANVSIFDSAIMFGDMVFEMTRVYNHEPFRLRHHLERLYASLKVTGIDAGMTIDEMEKVTLETIEINNECFDEGIDFQIMHNVSRGPLPVYKVLYPDGIKSTVTINCWPLIWHIAAHDGEYENGVHLVITPQQSVPARFLDPKIKNRSRLYYQIANIQAEKMEKGSSALLTDEDGFITEGTGNNFFMVKDGELFTPEGRNILRGVTRGEVIELAGKLGIRCHEVDLEPYDLASADEAFITSTTIAIIPATLFNWMPIGDGKVGPIVKSLTEAFSEMVGVDIVAQAKLYAKLARYPGAR